MHQDRLHRDAIIWYLHRTGLFEHSDPHQLEAAARSLRVIQYRRREKVLLSTEVPDRVYLLLTGLVKVSRIDPDTGKELTLFIVRPGEPFGLFSDANEGSAALAAVALEHSHVGDFCRDDFDRFAHGEPLASELNRLIRKRFAKLATRLEDIAFHDIDARLARLLLRLARDFPAHVAGHRAIGVQLTQQDLADLIGATRERTSKSLNSLQRHGLIDFAHHHLWILNPLGLEKTAFGHLQPNPATAHSLNPHRK